MHCLTCNRPIHLEQGVLVDDTGGDVCPIDEPNDGHVLPEKFSYDTQQQIRRSKRTPWGDADYMELIAEGILCVSTPSHGGIWLSPQRRKQLSPDLLGRPLFQNPPGNGHDPTHAAWYEEDKDVEIVVLGFPQFFHHADRISR